MTAVTATSPAPGRSAGGRGLHRAVPVLGTVPFFAYVTVFLLVPTMIVIVGAFRTKSGAFTWGNIKALGTESVVNAFVTSIVLSLATAVIGAVVGAVVAYVLSTAGPDTLLRKFVTAICSVLAQFGGVMLAFAFIAAVGTNGTVTRLLGSMFGVESTGAWLYTMPGLILVYSYFQIPLMVLVFLPAVDGIRPQWREAADTLGGSTWVYWTRVAGPLLAPAFLGCLLLLFANAFSAYATAAALITQSNKLVPLQISGAITNEINVGQADVAKALALGMVVVIAVVMWGYTKVSNRAARWLG
jgi:putative spermidine/putrescine transport system permease protein